jgi:hypothetical protein
VDSAGFGIAGVEIEDRDRDARITYYPGVSRSADAVPVNPGGQDASGIDIRIPNTAVFTVSGTVSGSQNLRRPDGTDARPAAMPFYLVSSDADNVDDPDILYLPHVGTENLGESRFELRGVAPGSYFLIVFQIPDRSALVSRVPLTVQDRDVSDLRLTLRPIPEVKGRIVIDGGASAVPPGPVGLQATPKERLPVLLSNTATRTTTQPTGEFTFPGLIEDIPYVPYVIGLPADAFVSDLHQRGLSVLTTAPRFVPTHQMGQLKFTSRCAVDLFKASCGIQPWVWKLLRPRFK